MSLNQTEKLLAAYKTFFAEGLIGSYVNGAMLPGEAEPIKLINPATGDVFLQYQDAGAHVAKQAVAAAISGQKIWAALSHAERGRLMQEAGRLLRANIEALAQLESISAGKPIRDCRGEALRVAEMFEYYGGWTDKLYGNVIPVPSGHVNYTRREPFGVILQITPWAGCLKPRSDQEGGVCGFTCDRWKDCRCGCYARHSLLVRVGRQVGQHRL